MHGWSPCGGRPRVLTWLPPPGPCSYVLFASGLPCPHIAAGANLSLPLVGRWAAPVSMPGWNSVFHTCPGCSMRRVSPRRARQRGTLPCPPPHPASVPTAPARVQAAARLRRLLHPALLTRRPGLPAVQGCAGCLCARADEGGPQPGVLHRGGQDVSRGGPPGRPAASGLSWLSYFQPSWRTGRCFWSGRGGTSVRRVRAS